MGGGAGEAGMKPAPSESAQRDSSDKKRHPRTRAQTSSEQRRVAEKKKATGATQCFAVLVWSLNEESLAPKEAPEIWRSLRHRPFHQVPHPSHRLQGSGNNTLKINTDKVKGFVHTAALWVESHIYFHSGGDRKVAGSNQSCRADGFLELFDTYIVRSGLLSLIQTKITGVLPTMKAMGCHCCDAGGLQQTALEIKGWFLLRCSLGELFLASMAWRTFRCT